MTLTRRFLFSAFMIFLVSPLWSEVGSWDAPALELLVEVQELSVLISEPDLRIVDFGRNLSDYEAGHIPGAVYLRKSDVMRTAQGIPNMLAPVDDISTTLSKAGIGNEHTVVIYDSGNNLWASRLFWTLEYLGHPHVSLLNGGWARWQEAGHEESTTPARFPGARFTASPRPELLADSQWILDNLDNPEVKVVDARSPGEYTGRTNSARRNGHIPGAINLDWVENLNNSGEESLFLDPESLRNLYSESGVGPDDEIVTHCQTGIRGAHTYFALRLLGHKEVRLYDGSWAEWGNADDTPVVTGDSRE